MGKVINVPLHVWQHRPKHTCTAEEMIKALRQARDNKQISKGEYEASLESICERFGLVNIYQKA